MDRLNAMEVFAAVCDTHSFAGAARRLGMSPPVVSRTVVALEKHLGVRLLQRTTRSVRLTDAGTHYLEQVRRVLSDVEAADEIARSEQEPRGRLVVTAPLLFGRMHVAALLRRYLAKYPNVAAELQLNDRNVHLIEEGYDLAVRIGSLSDSSLVARQLGTTRRVVVASHKYLDARGRPAHPQELDRHAVISFFPMHGLRDWLFADPRAPSRELRVAVVARFATNDGEAALDFAREGGGLLRCLHYQVAAHVAAGELEIVLADYERPPAPINAVYASARLLPARVRAFVALALENGVQVF